MSLDTMSEQVQTYLESLVPPRPAELAKLEVYAVNRHFPIIGPVAGYFCYQVARMMGARRVFEMGSAPASLRLRIRL